MGRLLHTQTHWAAVETIWPIYRTFITQHTPPVFFGGFWCSSPSDMMKQNQFLKLSCKNIQFKAQTSSLCCLNSFLTSLDVQWSEMKPGGKDKAAMAPSFIWKRIYVYASLRCLCLNSTRLTSVFCWPPCVSDTDPQVKQEEPEGDKRLQAKDRRRVRRERRSTGVVQPGEEVRAVQMKSFPNLPSCFPQHWSWWEGNLMSHCVTQDINKQWAKPF